MIIQWHECIPSTQSYLKDSPVRDTLVATLNQHAGYGRNSTNWFAIDKTLCLSVVLDRAYVDILGVVRDVLVSYGVPCVMKWPNDVLVCREQRFYKVVGVLINQLVTGCGVSSVVGIGVNLGYVCGCDYGCRECNLRDGSYVIRIEEYSKECNQQKVNNKECNNISGSKQFHHNKNYKTIHSLTGITIYPYQFINTFLEKLKRDKQFEYDFKHHSIKMEGKEYEIVNRRKLRVMKDGGMDVDVDVWKYNWESNELVRR